MLPIEPHAATPLCRDSTSPFRADLNLFITKMIYEGCTKQAIETFSRYYLQLRSGDQGFIPESEISALHPEEITDYSSTAAFQQSGEKLLPQTVVIKLNGGLGTTMGCDGPKSLIEIRPGLDFLAIAVERTRKSALKNGRIPPFILMNSFHTDPSMRDAAQRYIDQSDINLQTFVQHKFPKVSTSTFLPTEYPQNPQLEWNPPGHGDLYSSIDTSGTLCKLLDEGYRYAFIANIDNVGAELDAGILGYMANSRIEFLMEVTDRSPADRKGGHVARHRDGYLLLRESAQCPQEDMHHFSDISRHRFFNTNNLWIDLAALQRLLERHDGQLSLPLIRNQKNVDPVDPATPPVFQLESAMGAALSLFQSAAVLRVQRTRFIPVKNCEDLLLLQSDSFSITNDFDIRPTVSDQFQLPEINLDRTWFATVDQLTAHFPDGPPSLRLCKRLRVEGDVIFGKNIRIEGAVTISNRTGRTVRIPDDSRIERDVILT